MFNDCAPNHQADADNDNDVQQKQQSIFDKYINNDQMKKAYDQLRKNLQAGQLMSEKEFEGMVAGLMPGEGLAADEVKVIASRIGSGHAFIKHAEALGIKTVEDLTSHIENVMNNADEVRSLSNGRAAYWHELTQTLVIHDPGNLDLGTVFRPDEGKAYFNRLW